MTQFTIAILCILLVVSGLTTLSYRDSVKKNIHTIKKLEIQISDSKRASIQSEAIYNFARMDNNYADFQEYNNYWGVYRSATVNGRTYLTTIKIFTDPDADFNRHEAEELCEMLNSK